MMVPTQRVAIFFKIDKDNLGPLGTFFNPHSFVAVDETSRFGEPGDRLHLLGKGEVEVLFRF